jgi:hypothetical protein
MPGERKKQQRKQHVLYVVSGRVCRSRFSLREDLPERLPTGHLRHPAIGIVFLIFIGEHGFQIFLSAGA